MSTETDAFERVLHDPDVTQHAGVPEDEVPGGDSAGWDISWDCRVTFADDMEFDDGRGLHVIVAIENGGYVLRTVTPAQLRMHAEHLLGLARRAEGRAKAEVPR